MSRAHCLQCERDYESDQPNDLCPSCRALEDRIYANRPWLEGEDDVRPWAWSRAAMRERLGIITDVDE